MKALIVGSGGREHALAWKLAQSPLVDHLYCVPGNPGMARLGECCDVDGADYGAIAALARDRQADLVVIGPEAPLAAGLADRLAEAGVAAFGPSANAAEIEASKTFAKEIMRRYDIPTAQWERFEDPDAAKRYVRKRDAPVVVKADGLAAGKGVTVAREAEVAEHAIDEAMVNKAFGAAGQSVVIEECLEGEEASILALTDGKVVLPLATSQDHKPAYDNGEGPNTGGMGAYSPAPVVTADMLERIQNTILQPCVDGLAAEGRPYRGVLYAGLMITAEGPQVIEFNCRFGDPEVQAVLPRMNEDLVPLLQACATGELAGAKVSWRPEACVTVVMASGGYPRSYHKGLPIEGIAGAEAEEGVFVFHAGTRATDGRLVTAGGRVLNVTALGPDIRAARERAYEAAAKIRFEGAHYRRDIAAKALRRD